MTNDRITGPCPRCLEEDPGNGMHSVTKCIGSSLNQLTALRAENARLREAATVGLHLALHWERYRNAQDAMPSTTKVAKKIAFVRAALEVKP